MRTYAIEGDATFDVLVSGDVSEQLSHTVSFGEALEVEFAPQAVYAEGVVIVPFALRNVGQVPLNFTTDVELERAGVSVETGSIESYLAVGEIATGELLFELSAGDYVLGYSTPLAQGE